MGLHKKRERQETLKIWPFIATRHIKVPNIWLTSKKNIYPTNALDTNISYEFAKALSWVLGNGKI